MPGLWSACTVSLDVRLYGGLHDGETKTVPEAAPAIVRNGGRYVRTNWKDAVGQRVYVIESMAESLLDPPASWTSVISE